jgi:hypothetical protein
MQKIAMSIRLQLVVGGTNYSSTLQFIKGAVVDDPTSGARRENIAVHLMDDINLTDLNLFWRPLFPLRATLFA